MAPASFSPGMILVFCLFLRVNEIASADVTVMSAIAVVVGELEKLLVDIDLLITIGYKKSVQDR